MERIRCRRPTTVTVNAPPPDLAITVFTVLPPTLTQGDIASIETVVSNLGSLPTGPFDVTITDTTVGATFITQNVPSLAAGTGIPLSFSWNSSGASVGAHTFESTHTWADGNAANDFLTASVLVLAPNAPPTANAGADQTLADDDGTDAEVVTLDGSGSSDSDGTIVSYTWTEGATILGTGVSITPNLSVGVHTISLEVLDDDGSMDSDTAQVTIVANQSPVADAGPDLSVADADGDGAESVLLDGSASDDSDGSIITYQWTEGATALGTGSILTHSFAVGTHDVTLTVTDNGGASSSHTMLVTVTSPGPTISITQIASPGVVDFNGREYRTANQDVYGNQTATPVVIGQPVFNTVTGADNAESHPLWTFTDGSLFVDDGNHWIQSRTSNSWTVQLLGDGTLRTATFYVDVYHNSGSLDYLFTAGTASTTISKTSNGGTLYEMAVRFTQDTTVTLEAQGDLMWSAFSLAAVVID